MQYCDVYMNKILHFFSYDFKLSASDLSPFPPEFPKIRMF